MPKRRIKNMTINEVSLVDRPAQQGAVIPILKRQNTTTQEKDISKMSETQTKELEALKAEVDDLRKAAEKFKALNALSKSEHDHYAKMEQADRDAFLAKTPYERETMVKEAEANKDVVYTAVDGTQYTKADGDKIVAMAKESDAMRKELDAQKAAMAEQELQKRALGYSHLPGTPQEVVTLLKAVDGIVDQASREAVIKMLNAHDATLSRSFKKAADIKGGIYDDESAEGTLEKLVADYAKEHQVSRALAYDKVLHTQAGRELYAKHLAQ